MRIRYQSSVAIGRNPVFKPYEEAIARNVRVVARPDTTVDIHGVERMSPHYERSRYARYLNGISIVRNAAQAEAEGYGAVAVGCDTDPCLEEVRDTVTIPTLFMMQTASGVTRTPPAGARVISSMGSRRSRSTACSAAVCRCMDGWRPCSGCATRGSST